tara:strand:+ start:946 stop:1602 length:657 start_codon:yes stop_codon:yes gene_type:complete
MIINHKHKFIFIHIPKCAGTSISTALYPYSNKYDTILGGSPDSPEEIIKEDGFRIHKHSTAQEIKRYATPERWEEYFVFTFVRHPVDRIISTYEWWKHTDAAWDPETKRIINEMSFKEFVFSDYTGLPQIDYLVSRGGGKKHFVEDKFKTEIDFIGSKEWINRDFAYVCGLLELPRIVLSKENVSLNRHPDNDYYLDDEIRREIQRKFHQDYGLLNYQ